MANTVYGPYAKTTWVDSTTAINQTRMNNLETSTQTALNGINADLSGPFVLSGITCTKDGSVANQLDIASGRAYVTMSDGTTGLIVVGADNTHTTSTISTTYYLFLKNDGTWQWSTTSTGPANSLAICQATTDGSGNISAVTDVRHTGGSGGIALNVARVLHQAVSATTDQLFLTYTPPVRGMYRANFYATYRNPTPQKVIAYIRHYDPDLAAYAQSWFTLASTGAIGQIMNGSQANNPGNNQGITTFPISFYSEAGQAMGVHFQDGGGTPNDVVSAVIERLS